MTEIILAHSEITNKIYALIGKEKVDITEQAIAEVKAIKALEQEPCENAISRQAVCEIINDIRDCISVEGYWAILERLKKLPPVNPTKTGHREYNDIYDHYLCGNCKTVVMDYDNYCSNCGYRMVEPQESEDKHISGKDRGE